MSMGENVEALRVAYKHTYADLAAAVGTDAQQMHYLVTKNSVRSKYAPSIARWYSVPLETLMSGNTEDVLRVARKPTGPLAPPATIQAKDNTLSSNTVELTTVFAQLPPNGQSLALALLRAIRDHQEDSKPTGGLSSTLIEKQQLRRPKDGTSNKPHDVSKPRARRRA